MNLTIQTLWAEAGFCPTPAQEQAILHTEGPLYLTAGPGSGKTRVLLWRTLNLIVFHSVSPDHIFLSTFTEKAAHQLKEGLKNYLGAVTNRTNQPYDLSKMYVGTIHSLCQRILQDKKLNANRGKLVRVMDELATYFFFANRQHWRQLLAAGDLYALPETEQHQQINQFFNPQRGGSSRHEAITNLISFFSRLSEEMADVQALFSQTAPDAFVYKLLKMYQRYRQLLQEQPGYEHCDFSLLQQKAFDSINSSPKLSSFFQHIIIDEYQDTNTIQEKLVFKLAEKSKNLCVVGDDDQALYRFRGATVENFVEFPQRSRQYLSIDPVAIPLNTNYRSRQRVVEFYTEFISRNNWKKDRPPTGQYRVHTKQIRANSIDAGVSVIASTFAAPPVVADEIAALVRQLVDTGKVEDPCQIAFLFPSLSSTQVGRMRTALEKVGLSVYAPRAGRFLDTQEAMLVFGVLVHILGKPTRGIYSSQDYNDFHDWLRRSEDEVQALFSKDKGLKEFIAAKQAEIKRVISDYQRLMTMIGDMGWDENEIYDITRMRRPLYDTSGISPQAQKFIGSKFLNDQIKRRQQEKVQDSTVELFTLKDVVTRSTSLDWTLLDLLYRLSGFTAFKRMYDLAEQGIDEGPICNLGLISQYLAKFIELYSPVIPAHFLMDDKLQRLFFMSFTYALYRRGESEFENAEDPFPKGRIPFLTVHQAKGLEFPVVVLGNPRKDDNGPTVTERTIRELMPNDGEPLDRMAGFDIARMFYVALSRAKNLLVIAHYRGQGQVTSPPFREMLDGNFPRIPDFDLATLPVAQPTNDKTPKAYSYTADYLLYEKCPRQYMVFRRYGLVPSRSQMQFFGSLVHRTIEDIHLKLIRQAEDVKQEQTAN